MYNLIKMELYKLFKSTSMWVLIVITVLYGLFSVAVVSGDLEYMKENQASMTSGENGLQVEEDSFSVNMGIYFNTSADWIDNDINALDYMLVDLQSGMYLVFVTIFTALFVNGENKNGFIKNIAGQINFKGKLVLAKLPALLIFNVIIFLVSYISDVIFIKLIMGSVVIIDGVDLSVTANYVKLILIQLLLHFAFSCIIMMLTSISKSQALGIGLGIAFSTGIGSLLWYGATAALHKLGVSEAFNIAKYTIVQNVQLVGSSFDFDNTARVLLVGSFFVIIASQIAMFAANNRDVR